VTRTPRRRSSNRSPGPAARGRRAGIPPQPGPPRAPARSGTNRLRSLLLDPEEQAFQQDWTRSEGFIAAFRKSIGDDINDPRFVELVGELALSSERFRALWARHDIRSLQGGTTTVSHPVVGELRVHRDKLPFGICSSSSTTPTRAARAMRSYGSSPP
jgi:hypothetical protein